jgi:hypothetical protein
MTGTGCARSSRQTVPNPTKGHGHKVMGIDRSALDMRIIAYAVNQGCSDGEIKAWFEDKQLRGTWKSGIGGAAVLI